eukprot:NODE_1334_length_1581_cov_29.585509_g1198_i0.p1 GENE.NODE_1334_length_1581_cov_29.585509_g1198_i0~~NODE_1334_length_1581_cov_29.585509_g1198_i0.p1  ORF type:complete len:375 (+),score=60.33 NODE_1334_length_1581_cov_29.585509_g1198_i0:283-1407(+)
MWEISSFAYIFSTLWFYSSVVANTMLSLLPCPGLTKYGACDAYAEVLDSDCKHAYWVWLGVELVVYLGLSLMDISKLTKVQRFLSVLSWASMAAMVLTCVAGSVTHKYPDAHSRNTIPYLEADYLFDFTQLGLLMSTLLFTQMLTWAVPSIMVVLDDKSRARETFSRAYIVTFTLYALIGTVTALYFGDKTLPTVTLNWRDFSFTDHKATVTEIICGLVIAVPLFTITCAFPLNARALASNLAGFMPRKFWKATLGVVDDPSVEWPPPRVHAAATLGTVIPAFALAFIERDASKIVMICGLFAFVMMFFIPCWLQWNSVRMMRLIWPGVKSVADTPFTQHVFSHGASVLLVFLFSVAAFGVVLYTTVRKVAGID